MTKPWFALIREVLFRIAFGVFIIVEVIVWLLFLLGVSVLFPKDNFLIEGVIVIFIFLGLFPIGAISYFIFQHATRAEYVMAESGRWLAERRATGNSWIRRRKILKRWVLWIPTVTVIVACMRRRDPTNVDDVRTIHSLFHASGDILGQFPWKH